MRISKFLCNFATQNVNDMNENPLIDIFDSIRDSDFSAHTLQLIDTFTNEILNGRANIHRFNLQEHAGLCTAGAPLIGAYAVCSYARASFESGRFSSEGQTSSPSNWEIDAKQEEVLQQWAYGKYCITRILTVCNSTRLKIFGFEREK